MEDWRHSTRVFEHLKVLISCVYNPSPSLCVCEKNKDKYRKKTLFCPPLTTILVWFSDQSQHRVQQTNQQNSHSFPLWCSFSLCHSVVTNHKSDTLSPESLSHILNVSLPTNYNFCPPHLSSSNQWDFTPQDNASQDIKVSMNDIQIYWRWRYALDDKDVMC